MESFLYDVWLYDKRHGLVAMGCGDPDGSTVLADSMAAGYARAHASSPVPEVLAAF